MTQNLPTRRRVLTVTAVGAVGAGALAACGSDEPAAEPTAAPTTEATTAAPATSAPAATQGGGDVITALADVPVGGAVAVKIAGKDAVVAQPQAGTVVAFDARCPHQGCAVEVEQDQYVCPCHGSKFEGGTGAVLNGPATKDLTPIAVQVSGSDVVAG